MHAKYSVLWYERNWSEMTFSNIEHYITFGIKVYYITETTEEQYSEQLKKEQLKTLEQWKLDGLLSLHSKVKLSAKLEDNILAEDGLISRNLEVELEQCNQFNLGQYRMEHANYDQNLVVMAGAGTGKTKTMIDRILFLVLMDYAKLEEIVMITFTNEAASQMREKLTKRLENYFHAVENQWKEKFLTLIDQTTGMKIQTIHSYSKYIFKVFGDKIGISTRFHIRNLDYQKRKILELLINEYHFENKDLYQQIRYIPQYKIIDIFMKINHYCLARGIDCGDKEICVDWGEGEELYKPLFTYLMSGLNEKINEYKDSNDVMELSDLVTKLTSISKLDSLPNFIQVSYLFVDEFQDTDDIQIQFIVWLMEQLRVKLCVVGDKKQGIYRFRGAAPTAFELLATMIREKMPNEKIEYHYLQMNYRSSKQLIYAFNSFFEKVALENLEFHFAKKDHLIETKESEYYSCIHTFPSSNNESLTDTRIEAIQELVEKVNRRNRLNHGQKQETVAVLTRTNKELERIVNKLESIGLVCETEVSGNFYRCAAVREFYIMLMALLHPKVAAYQYAFVNSSYGEGDMNQEVLEHVGPEKLNYIKNIVENKKSWKRLQIYRDKLNQANFLEVLYLILDEFKPFLNYGMRKEQNYKSEEKETHISKAYTTVRNYKKNLDYLFQILESNFSATTSTLFELEEFLRIQIETDNIVNEKFVYNTGMEYDLVCMTVHKAKGLEFDHVVLPETKHQFVNHASNVIVLLHTGEKGKIEIGYRINVDNAVVSNSFYTEYHREENIQIIAEEVRLLYVALTRAKKSLHICKDLLVDNIGKPKNWMELIDKGGLCR